MTPLFPKPIRLLVLDIDGCLLPAHGLPYDLGILGALRRCAEMSPDNPAVPAVTFLTGRPIAYVDALLRIVDTPVPAVCDNGATIFLREEWADQPHPAMPEGAMELLAEVSTRLQQELLNEHEVLEPGKINSLTVVPRQTGGRRPPELLEGVTAINLELGEPFDIGASSGCLHLTFKGVNKGTAIHWLAEVCGIASDEMAGIGDSPLDAPFLREVAWGAAPADAHPEALDAADAVMPSGPPQCIAELIEQVIRQNAHLLEMESETDRILAQILDFKIAPHYEKELYR